MPERTVHNSTLSRKPFREGKPRREEYMERGPMESRSGGLKGGKKPLRQWHEKHEAGTRARVKQDLHEVVSKIVRLRDGRCVICGESDWQKLTCGHFYKRGWVGTAFDLRNCNCLCKECNWRDNKNSAPYQKYMLETYGHELVSQLFTLRNQKRFIPTWELEEMLAEYRLMLRKMRRAA